MKCIADVNVLLPLILEQHPHRSSAERWWDGQGAESVFITLPVRMATLRLLTNSKVMGSGVLSPEAAWQTLADLWSDVRIVLRHDVPVGLDTLWSAFVRGREPSPNLWTDAWLAAFAEAEGSTLVTFDRGFRRFPLSHLEVLPAAVD